MYIPSNFGNDYKRRQNSPLTEIFNSVSFEVNKKSVFAEFLQFCLAAQKGCLYTRDQKTGGNWCCEFYCTKVAVTKPEACCTINFASDRLSIYGVVRFSTATFAARQSKPRRKKF